MRSEYQLLTDAVEALNAIEDDLQDLDRSAFDLDQTKRQSIYWSLSVLGECSSVLVRNDMSVVEQFPELRNVLSVQNRLVHGYFAIDDDIVWDIITVHLVRLAPKLRHYLAELDIKRETEHG
jgi:uncharacterized protein with HEPN domain